MEIVKDAVQPVEWYIDVPRKQFEEFERINLESDWFTAYKLPNNIVAICEACHFQEVITYLIFGSEKTLMLDTGMGMFDIKKEVVDVLNDKPLIVVNSHTHFDHVGGNNLFDEVYVFNNKYALDRLKTGVTAKDLEANLEPRAFHYDKELPFKLEEFEIKGVDNYKPIEQGHIFDLGNRKFKVINTQGHSPDSIMLVNEEEKILFTGDTVYPASLYAHFVNSNGLNSVLDTYQKTMHELSSLYSDYILYCSHNEPIRKGSMLTDIANAFDRIQEKNLPFILDEEGFKKYQFDGFAIITA